MVWYALFYISHDTLQNWNGWANMYWKMLSKIQKTNFLTGGKVQERR